VGQIKICSSAIKIVKGKIFLLLALQLPKKIKELKGNVIAEASLSIEHPIAVVIGKEWVLFYWSINPIKKKSPKRINSCCATGAIMVLSKRLSIKPKWSV